MFTGIIQELGEIASVTPVAEGLSLGVVCPFSHLTLGESISVDGVCLTVTQLTSSGFVCDVSPETLRLTLARNYRPGTVVNLERALRVGDALGGHWVSGHVDCVICLSRKEVLAGFWKLNFSGLSKEESLSLLKKGSVAVNGVSLTLNEIENDGFEVMIVPHTLEKTNLKLLEVGDEVNIEIDWMSKLVVQTLQRMKEGF